MSKYQRSVGLSGSRELALLGIGVLAALLFGVVRSARAEQAGRLEPTTRVQYWAADRDGDHVFGLDGELLLRTKIAVQRPLRVAARHGGGAWVLHAMGTSIEPHGLLRIDEWGRTQAVVALGECSDLATWRGRDALVIERLGGTDRVLRVNASGRKTRLFEGAGLRCLATRGDVLIVGDAGGGLTRVSLDSGGAEARRVPCETEAVARLAPASDDGWWLLAADFRRTLTRLNSELEPLWSTPTHAGSLDMVVAQTGDSVWLAEETRPVLRKYGELGRLIFQRDATLAGIGRGVPTPDGGAIFAAPGALLRFDERGAALPGQGGFEFLVDVSAVRNRVPLRHFQ